jgi:hypothetical protein
MGHFRHNEIVYDLEYVFCDDECQFVLANTMWISSICSIVDISEVVWSISCSQLDHLNYMLLKTYTFVSNMQDF